MSKLKLLYLQALLITAPFIFWINFTQDPLRGSKLAIMLGGGSLIVGFITASCTRWSFGALLGYITFNSLFTGFGFAQSHELVVILVSFCALIPLIGLTESYVKSFTSAISWSGVGLAALAIMQICHYDPIFSYYDPKDLGLPVSTLGQQTLYGPYMAVCVVASLYMRRYLLALIMAGTIVFTWSSFSYLSLGVGVVLYGYEVFNKKHLTVFYIGAGAGLAIKVYFDYLHFDAHEYLYDNGRFMAWRQVLNVILSFDWFKHLFGIGIGTFKYTFHTVQSDYLNRFAGAFEQAHNEYLQAYYELGIIGSALIVWCFGDLSVLVWKRFNMPMVRCWAIILLTLMANAIGNFPMHMSPHAHMVLASFLIIATMKNDLIK